VIKIAGETKVIICATDKDGTNLTPSVEIWCTKLDHNMETAFMQLPVYRQQDTSGSDNKLLGSSDELLIDLGTSKEVISIQGFLRDQSGASDDSAQEKKDNLRDLALNYRKIKIRWGTGANRQQSYRGNINKCMITETAGIVGVQKTGYESEKNFAVTLSLVVGTDYS